MRLEQLRYIVTIADYKSFSQASNSLFLSPQALSRSMTALEQELGITLFIRLSTGIQFTREGELILSMARKMLKEYDDTIAIIRNKKQKAPYKIYLYSYSVFIEAYLNRIALNYRNQQAESEVEIVIREFSYGIWEKICRNQKKNWAIFIPYLIGTKNVPLLNEIMQEKVFITDDVLSCKHIVCVSKDSALAKQKEISLKMLATMPCVRFSGNDEENVDDKIDMLDIYYGEDGVRSPYRVNNLTSWIDAVADGIGVGLLDGLVYKHSSKSKALFEKVKVLSVSDPITIKHGFVTEHRCPDEITDFVEFAIDELKKFL